MVLSENQQCEECTKLQRLLRQREKRKSALLPEAQVGRQSRSAVKSLRKRVIRATAVRERLKEEVRNLGRQMSSIPQGKIDEAMKQLPHSQQLAFRTALDAITKKSAKGKRYYMEWMMTCLLLKISSPNAYKHITQMGLLPLPSATRLKQIIKGAPCEFGFNQLALTSIRAQFADLKGRMCYGTLILDEMKVRKAVSLNHHTYKLDGFIDYGDDSGDQASTADHALVLMFVPLFHGWVQPIASFATRNAAPGTVLARLVLQAILELEKQNAMVIAVISDGATTNKAMWSKFRISGKLESPRHKVPDPCDPRLNLYFLCDTPHLIKCIRNHLLQHQQGMVSKVL